MEFESAAGLACQQQHCLSQSPSLQADRNPFYPLEINPITGEPFLRLPPPHTNIILTPPRAGDDEDMVRILNDPRVASGLAGIVLPYPREKVLEWLTRARKDADAVLEELRGEAQHASDSDVVVYASGCPVRSIREIMGINDEVGNEQVGRDIFLGELAVLRGRFEEVPDPKEREEVERVDKERRAGDPNIRWTFADYIAPSHHGRGIMSAAVNAVLNTWMVPRMNVHKVVVFTFAENAASERVFLKNGFAHAGVDNGMVVRGEVKRLVWTRSIEGEQDSQKLLEIRRNHPSEVGKLIP